MPTEIGLGDDPTGGVGDDPEDDQASGGGGGGSPTTAPAVVGPITLSILSGVNACGQLSWRQGDTQPAAVLQLLDGNLIAIDLSGATVTFNSIVPGTSAYCQTSDMVLGEDNVTVTLSRGVDDFTTVNAGRYYFLVRAVWGDGTGFSGPDACEAVLVVESSF